MQQKDLDHEKLELIEQEQPFNNKAPSGEGAGAFSLAKDYHSTQSPAG